MYFDIANAIKKLYREYAITKGFGIRTRNSKKGPDNELRYFMLVCARARNIRHPFPPKLTPFQLININV